MAELTVDMTYGSALFQAAKELGKTDIIAEEAAEIRSVFEKEKTFFKALTFPEIAADEKMSMVENVFGGKVSLEMVNFLKVLIKNSRMGEFDRIVRMFEKLRDEEAGVSQGLLYSTESLEEGRIRALEEQTSALMKRRIRLVNKIDKSLIGGIKIVLDGKIIDASLKKRLDEIGSSIRQRP